MKQLYTLIIFLFSYFSFSQNFADTKGELQISSSGTAVYTLPIAVPPSIKGIAPAINLVYSSGVRGGIAGQGWSISSISAVSRIATRRDIDGFTDGVDFDNNDKLALNGQRLLLKSGTYWAPGSIYETEYKSNTKVELVMEGIVTYFVVTAPDGSRSWYGSTGSGNLQNSASLNSWYIVHYEDVSGNFIDYNYKTITYNGSNQLYIDNIAFSGNIAQGIAAQNKIIFAYHSSKRIERDYLKGVPLYATQMLENIKVYANNNIFRTYKLSHATDGSLGYERLISIQEVNADEETSNPVVFGYDVSPSKKERTQKTYSNNLAFNDTDMAGDFDGDGRLDFIADNKIFTNLFKEDTGGAPINLPFTANIYNKSQMFPAIVLSNNKLNQFNSIVNVENLDDRTNFNYYRVSGGSVFNDYTKTIFLNNSVSNTDTYTDQYLDEDPYYVCGVPNNCATVAPGFSTNYSEGDFNGDGISEVLIEHSDNESNISANTYVQTPYGSCQTCVQQYSTGGISYYMLDLNPASSVSLNSKGFHKIINATNIGYGGNIVNGASGYSRKFIADFNGDGKSDILTIKDNNKTYKIISFNQLDSAPWTEVQLLGSGTIDKYSGTKQILIGDYNGDGKVDIMMPDGDGGQGQFTWHIYYSNANPAGGEFFTKETHSSIVEYWPDTGSRYNTERHYSNYYAIDINKDGKSDLVRVWRKYYKPSWTINDHNTAWQVTAFANNIGNSAAAVAFPLVYNSDNGNLSPITGLPVNLGSDSPDIPIPVTSNYRYNGANTDLVIVRGHNNKIEYYQFNKNADTENRLVSVSESNGNIVQAIEYKAMESLDSGLGNAATDFYSSENTSLYPDVEIIRNPDSYLVSKLKATINGVSKYQDFRYRSYVSNFNYGTVGFKKTTRSSWYLLDSDTKIWTTQYNNISLRGANTITWTNTNASTVFDITPSNLLTTKTNVFSTYTDPLSKVYNLLLDSQTIVDALSAVKSENTYTYDGTVASGAYYGLETKRVSKYYSGATLQGSLSVDSQYDNNPTGIGSQYYIGRPKKTISLSNNTASGDTRTSEELYTYTGFNLTKIEKKGHNTYAVIEEMTYDNLGNLLTKTVSAPGAPAPVPVARTIKDEYDSTKRFVVRKTDHQGFVTNYAYNNLGQLTQSTDYLGVSSDFTYDSWGKLTSTTTTGLSLVPITSTNVYTRLGSGGYTMLTTNNLESKTVTEYDVLGRIVKNSVKGFAVNSMVTKQIVYDGLGRKEKESEPFFSTPSLWTSYEYDYLMRPTKITAPTGKIQTFSYSILTTTSNDDGKITTVTADALGNKVQSTDPGGTINFTYFANGKLKESDYQGNKVKIDIDGWGNKTRMEDPSAGVYTYSYDAFGQLKTETTPNGTTTFVYDAVGKTIEKTIIGDITDSKTNYVYNTLNQLTSTTYVDNIETKSITNTYDYDALKRRFKTTEITPYAVFVKQLAYDSLGRVEKETSTATVSGKTSSKTVKNTYQNGFPWQILDDATQQVLWQSNNLNERGQLLNGGLGNGITITNTYDQYGYVKQIKHDKTSSSTVNFMTLNTSFEIKRGNLNSRSNSLFNRNETFNYDGLDRLIEYTNEVGIQESQSYDEKGRITQNSVGTYEYDESKIYQNNALILTPEALDYYQNRSITIPYETAAKNSVPDKINTEGRELLAGPLPPPPASTVGLEITYNTFKSPVTIRERGGDEYYIDYIDFTYNDNNDRSTMFYGGLDEDKLLRRYRKHYSADGTMEVKEDLITGISEFITYIGGDGYSAPMVVKSDGITQNYLYLHRDYQGTIIAVSDQSGGVVEKRLFDAWGSIIEVQDGAGNILAGLTVLDRGYTGHEHIQNMGLINMNGRLYDPKLHRFLQPDNLVQEPFNTQNYNKYAYVLNNPLKYTDPSGEEAITFGAVVIIGAVIAATTYTLTALLADVPFNVGGLLKATFIGAASSAVTFGIGSAAGTITNFYVRAAVSSVMHGAFQGSMTAISGGKFWSGFAAGALSSIAASAFGSGFNHEGLDANGEMINVTKVWNGAGSLADSGIGVIAFGTVSGGAGAAITDGNFWQGAVTGLVVSGLNHTMHKMQERQSFKEQLKAKGINHNGKFGFTEEAVGKNINAIKELRMLASKVDSKISAYEFRPALIAENGMEAYGESEMMPDNSWKVSLSMSKIVTNLDFVYTIGHEFTHILNMSNMNYAGFSSMTNTQKYQEELNVWTDFNQFYGDPNAQAGINYYKNLLKK